MHTSKQGPQAHADLRLWFVTLVCRPCRWATWLTRQKCTLQFQMQARRSAACSAGLKAGGCARKGSVRQSCTEPTSWTRTALRSSPSRLCERAYAWQGQRLAQGSCSRLRTSSWPRWPSAAPCAPFAMRGVHRWHSVIGACAERWAAHAAPGHLACVDGSGCLMRLTRCSAEATSLATIKVGSPMRGALWRVQREGQKYCKVSAPWITKVR